MPQVVINIGSSCDQAWAELIVLLALIALIAWFFWLMYRS